LGSASNTECRIDSLAQSWGVISGAADPERARQAMNSVREYLIQYGDDLVLLFTPPFDKTLLDPGYIKGYLPGVRENGGNIPMRQSGALSPMRCSGTAIRQGSPAYAEPDQSHR